MTGHVPARVWAVWATLVTATLFTGWLATDRIGGAAVPLATAVAFAKVWLIGRHFMDLRDAAVPLRRAFDAWTVVVGGAVVALLLV